MTPRHKFDLSSLPDHPDLSFENKLWGEGLRFVAGVDEAGRGALAGPVAAGAVVLPCDLPDLANLLEGVNDSKVMTPAEREAKAEIIRAVAFRWGVGFATSAEIDRIGILPATCLAVSRAILELKLELEHVLVDYLRLPDLDVPQTPLVKGDARCLSIAAASILAKTARDAVLVEMDGTYPGYYFASNKGYGTQAHRQAIAQLGPCDQHRKTFSPVKDYYSLFPPE
ncbi:MAG: ribonuclease HII [Brevefilum sp.]|nr:ribonuclease HII [Brevefilum sp.]MDT8380980.1 ribonuclease HII [Brevefilum sp.]